MNEQPQFTPKDGSPTIHVNIRTNREKEDEMGRLWSEHIEQTKLAEEKAKKEEEEEANMALKEKKGGHEDDTTKKSSVTRNREDGKLVGEEKYDLSVKTTYEYDVVACEDYVEDIGCWVRNMPEEIRLANPDFVPT